MDKSNENILENKELYIHQFLAAIFQITLKHATPNPDNKDQLVPIQCRKPSDAVDRLLTFANYSDYLFETMVEEMTDRVGYIYYIDKRFLTECVNLFNKLYRVYDDDANTIGYLFNCYCRCLFVKDFANLIPKEDLQSLKRYIVGQVTLQLVCPAVNIRYQANEQLVFIDLFKVITFNIPWPMDYLSTVKKFFLDVVEAMEMAKDRDDENNDSALAGLSKDEISVEKVIQQLYILFCNKFKKNHKLSHAFVDDIKFINILIASPKLAQIFIDLNSPNVLKKDSNEPAATSASARSASSSNNVFSNNISDFFFNMTNGSDVSLGGPSQLEKNYHESLLGILLCSSPLTSPYSKRKPNNADFLNMIFESGEYEYPFFPTPANNSTSGIEQEGMEIDDQLYKLRSIITELFFSLLKSSPVVRGKTLKWLECCLASFNSRAKLWPNEIMSMVGGSGTNTSDGMMLNLSSILLNLCKPFCSIVDLPTGNSDLLSNINPKMLKVDLGYMRYAKLHANVDNETHYGAYLEILNQESSLVSQGGNRRHQRSGAPNTNQINSADSNAAVAAENELACLQSDMKDYQPNFITRCFFSTHKALHLGFRVVHERLTVLTQENSQLQRRLESLGIRELSLTNPSMMTQQQKDLLHRFDQNMTITLSLKAGLTENNFLNLVLEFYLATAAWINNLTVCESEEEATKSFKEIVCSDSLKRHSDYFHGPTSKCLRYIPEFIIDNIIDFMLFLRYFEVKPKMLSIKNDLEPFLTMVVLFIGNSNRMRNPHLRAKMAEMLEALLPNVQLNIQPMHLENLFNKPYFVDELFPSLLNVFVSIEISDDSNNGDVVAFEQKFNYRRPMYVVFRYLCTISEHQKKLLDLADFAEHNIDSVESPIFLRFINLLINDAIYLLDEGLSLMSKLRETQQERDSGTWARETAIQRQQNEANFAHLGRLAKFHNFIGRDTITALSTITDYVKSVFSHKVLVDRMASMLNYFLLNLVGPKKKNFKVKQMTDYEFSPGDLVRNICRIYVNLACPSPMTLQSVTSSDVTNPKYEEFCLAIARDDRSYSPELLKQAQEVLVKLNQPMLGEDLLLVDRTIKDVVRRNRQTEIPLDDIPEEFLDPLMSTLMSDPVILPGSRKVLDRSTITRHLLSDNSDPYTRAPLTMNMLIPDVELKSKIEAFIVQKVKELEQENPLAQSSDDQASGNVSDSNTMDSK